jgi:hypothetical protein
VGLKAFPSTVCRYQIKVFPGTSCRCQKEKNIFENKSGHDKDPNLSFEFA